MPVFIPNINLTKATRGITLIELLLVLSIIMVLSAYSIPAFSDLVSKQRLEGVALQIQSGLYNARKNAIKNTESQTISFQQSNTHWCMGISQDKGTPVCDCLADDECSNRIVFENSHGVTLQQARFAGGDDYTGFDSRRGSTLVNGKFRNGSVWLQSLNEKQIAIIVSRFGRIRICATGESRCPTPP